MKMFKVLLTCMGFVRCDIVSVETSIGTVIGRTNDGYNTFFGVPYARVDPVCPFGKPKKYLNFTPPFQADDSSVMCPQIHHEEGGTIQCLRMNIYVPQTDNTKLAILVWFPSYFEYGCAGDYGGEHLVKEDIIVIIVNFRLGMYGFSCLNEPYVPGNMALRDQVAALSWIQTNILKFGGDPRAVTIGGQGYGGGLVDLHLYLETESLFDKAIIQSGSIFAKGFYGASNPAAILKIAKHLGQQVDKKTKPADVLPYVYKLDPIKVMNVSKTLGLKVYICTEKQHQHGIPNFVTKGPFQFNKFNKIKNTKILIGYNSMELLGDYVDNNNDTKEFYEFLGNVFYNRLNETFELPHKEKEELSKLIRKFYIGGQDIGPAARIQLIEAGSDLHVNYPVEMSVDRFIQAGATVYKYLFSYTGGSQFNHIQGSGAPREEELKYLFEMETKIEGLEQEKMRETLISYWTNFVKYGNPTLSRGPSWVPVTEKTRSYMDINVRSSMKENVYRRRMGFLDLLFYSYKKYIIVS